MSYRFDLRTLQIFVRIVQVGGVTRAAELENIAPSAVSKRVAELEQSLGVELLRRLPRKVEPTAAGTILYRYATDILHSLSRLSDELSHHASGARGSVRMAVNKSAIAQFLPQDLYRFERRHPGVEITLEEKLSKDVLHAVRDGSVDIGIFVEGSGSSEQLEVLPYRRDRLAVFVPRTHPLADQGRVRFEALLEFDLIGVEPASALELLVERHGLELGKTIKVKYRVNSFDGVCRMAAAGLGVAIGPPGMVSLSVEHDLIEVELDEPWAARRLSLVCRRVAELSAPAHLLLEHMMPVASDTAAHQLAPSANAV